MIHGFLHNWDAFRRLGLEAPETEAAFFAVLERIREDGALVPMALGLRDRWEAATVGCNNIGPAYWKGEEGRRALVTGRRKLTDEPWIAPFRTLARCRSTIRFASRFLSRGAPGLERAAWDAAVAAITGTASAEELGARLQEGLAGWYAPRR